MVDKTSSPTGTAPMHAAAIISTSPLLRETVVELTGADARSVKDVAMRYGVSAKAIYRRIERFRRMHGIRARRGRRSLTDGKHQLSGCLVNLNEI